MKKLNCWEHKRCGKESGGLNNRLGVCPSATEVRLNAIHGGVHGGRSCWVVARTLCCGLQQGSFAEKISTCERCDFYQTVKREEGREFVLSAVLLGKVRRISHESKENTGVRNAAQQTT